VAVARMQKVQILFHASVKKDLLEEIQKIGLVHVNSFKEGLSELPEGISFVEETGVQELEALLSGLEFALAYLKPFEEKSGGLIKFSAQRVEVSEEEYRNLVDEFDGQQTVQACRQLERERIRLTSELNEKQGLIEQLGGWADLDIPLEELAATANSEMLIGSVPMGQFSSLSQRLEGEVQAYQLELVGTYGIEENCLILYHRLERDTVMRILEEVEFAERRFPNLKGTPQQEVERLEKELLELQKALGELREKSRKFVEQRPKLMVLAEHVADDLEKRRAEFEMANTERVSLLEGWVKEKEFMGLQNHLENAFGPLSVTAIDPLPGESPPVELVNKPVPGSFEMVIDLYGRPKYTELDPTPILAPFFAVFFGLCLTDAGYGLTLAVLSFVFLRKLRLGPGTRKLFQLLFWSGLVTIVAGAITGGYFGIDWSKLNPESPVVKAVYAVKLFDPIGDAMTFFKIAIVLGVVHIFVGLTLKMLTGIREGKPVQSVLMHGPWLLADVGVGISMLNFLSPVGEGLAKLGTYSLFAGLGGIFLFSGIGTKNPFAWLGKGLGGIYGVIGIFSDILSYSRLVALGLATAVIAGVIDTLGGMLMKIPFVGIFMAIILFLIAHVAYMVISCLGAFVHTARLNFVEFFSKFYEGGGETFNPLRKRGQYVLWRKKQEEFS
jgi:V/A-type H+-transporting ATPase subunit I